MHLAHIDKFVKYDAGHKRHQFKLNPQTEAQMQCDTLTSRVFKNGLMLTYVLNLTDPQLKQTHFSTKCNSFKMIDFFAKVELFLFFFLSDSFIFTNIF